MRQRSALLRFMSALANNTAFGAYEHASPVLSGASETEKRASGYEKRRLVQLPPAVFSVLQASCNCMTTAIRTRTVLLAYLYK